MNKYIAYYRVSTDRQGKSGLGLDAQRKSVADYLNGNGWEIVEEFTEVESGKKTDRPQLDKALASCRLHKATLVIAKIDRLARNAAFLLNLKDAGVDFIACDMPDANRLTVGIMALMAEHEREMISQRTKAALAQAKIRGKVLGGYRGYTPNDADRAKAIEVKRTKATERDEALSDIITGLSEDGIVSLRGIASVLNERSIPAPRGGQWQATSVQRLMKRIAA